MSRRIPRPPISRSRSSASSALRVRIPLMIPLLLALACFPDPPAETPSPSATPSGDATPTQDPTPSGDVTPTPSDPTPTATFEPTTPAETPSPTLPLIDPDGDGFTAEEGDCDDADPDVYPGATEACDGQDGDCDGTIDEEAIDPQPFYPDGDGDGVGAGAAPVVGCAPPMGYAPGNGDCDDADPDVYPGAEEVCDTLDDDCDSMADEGIPTDRYYADLDGDGYGTGPGETTCDPGDAASLSFDDCDDDDDAIYPGALESCDAVDEDCDGHVDEGAGDPLHPDPDGDGFGSPRAVETCAPGPGLVANGGDCESASPFSYPGAPELCDGRDNDCDGRADEGLPDAGRGHRSFYHRDGDGDGFGDEGDARCTPAAGYVAARGDCDDDDPSVHPGAADAQGDGIDADCGGHDGPDPHLGFGASSATNIATALSRATDLTTIWVAPGTYSAKGQAFPADRALKLRSTHFPGETTLVPEGENYILGLANQGVETVLDGFTLMGGLGKSTGALLVSGGAGPTVTNLQIKGSRASVGSGGGLNASPQILRLSYLTLEANSAAVNGGGGTLNASGGSLTRSVITHNSAGSGGGLFLQGSGYALEDVELASNDAQRGGGAYGGGIAEVALTRCPIWGNVAQSGGGGLYLSTSQVHLSFLDVRDNDGGTQGGGILLTGSALSSTLTHLILVNNGADAGGGVYLGAPDATLTYATLAGNEAMEGAGIFVVQRGGEAPGPVLRGVAVVENAGAEIGGDGSAPWALDVRYSALSGGEGEHPIEALDPSVVTAPPGFVGEGDPWDVHLSAGSPLIDAGPPEDQDPDGSPADIGAYGGPDAGGWDD